MKAMKTVLTDAQLESLRKLNACLLANAIETFHQRLRNEGFASRNVRCLFPYLPPHGRLRRHHQGSRFGSSVGGPHLS